MSYISWGRTLFRPSLYQLIILLVLVSLSTVLPNNERATSKISWEVNRGLPFTVVTIEECRGPCKPIGFIYPGTIRSFSLSGLLMNILCISIMVMLVGLGLVGT